MPGLLPREMNFAYQDRTDIEPGAEIGRLGVSAWLDDADLSQDLRDARRVLRIELHRLQEAANRPAAAAEWECPWPPEDVRDSVSPATAGKPGNCRLGGWAWLVLCCGAMLLVAGGVLLCLAYFAARLELWQPGLLAAISGQLLVVLVTLFPRAQSRTAGADRQQPQPHLPRWKHVLGERAA